MKKLNPLFVATHLFLTKALKIFLLIYLFISNPLSYCQTSGVQPIEIPGYNSVSFDADTYTYNFYLNDSLCYSYTILPDTSVNGGSLNVLKAYDYKGNYLLPSNFGGIRAFLEGDARYPFDPGVSFNLLENRILSGDTVLAYWKMMYGGDYIKYKYKFKITGRTLSIVVEVDSAYSDKVMSLELDRCENANKPSAIAVTYLPLFYILYANDMFTSFYADWEVSNASQILVCDGSKYSESSVRYAQNLFYNTKTNGHRNRMFETLYLTTSSNIIDVFPNIPNPVSKNWQESAKWIIWDFRPSFNQLISPSSERYLEKIYGAGIRNIWLQIHNWQANHGADVSYGYSGYDDGLPCVLPVNRYYGGTPVLNSVILKVRSYKYRVGLHENYVDYYVNSEGCTTGPGYSESDVALDQNTEKIKANKNNYYKEEQSYFLKPSRAAYYAGTWSRLIQAVCPNLNSCYLDVHSSVLPSTNYVDYDASVKNAGMFRETMLDYRALFDTLRKNHSGLVQGEGGNQIFYQGYADDIEARLEIPNKYASGITLPVFVDFDMLKLRPKAFVHGVGYYPIFYTENDYRTPRATKEIILQYIATELAYGHGGYIPTPDLTWAKDDSIIAHAKLEYKFVFSVQNDYAKDKPEKILYNDNDTLKNVSDYIRSHPVTYGNISSNDFMGQVMVAYNNGVIVCVNRHPTRSWKVDIGKANGWFDYNANGILNTGVSLGTTFTLPPKNGWVVYDPLK
jgi:hypothetical protein